MYWNLFNKCNLFPSSEANRAGYYYCHIYFIFLTFFFFSVKSWLTHYLLAAHGRWVKLNCAVSIDWTHESQVKFLFSAWRSYSRTSFTLQIFTNDLHMRFHSRQLLPRHFLQICVYMNIPHCELSKRQKVANMSWKLAETEWLQFRYSSLCTSVQGLREESVNLSIFQIFLQQTLCNWDESQLDDTGM